MKITCSKRATLILPTFLFLAFYTLWGISQVKGQESHSDNMKETPLLNSALLVQEALLFKKSLLNLKIRYQVEDSQISFEDKNLPLYKNDRCQVSTCRVFSVEDGRQAYKKPPSQILDRKYSDQELYGDWLFTSNICIPGVGRGGENCSSDGIDNEELIVLLPYIEKEICSALDKDQRLLDDRGKIPKINNGFSKIVPMKYQGKFEDALSISSFQDNTDIFSGKTYGCFAGADNAYFPADTFHFFFVLLPR